MRAEPPKAEYNVMGYQPAAAESYNGDHECSYDGCDQTADWVVEWKSSGYTGGKASFCCQSCSQSNHVDVEADLLYERKMSDGALYALPDQVRDHLSMTESIDDPREDGDQDV